MKRRAKSETKAKSAKKRGGTKKPRKKRKRILRGSLEDILRFSQPDDPEVQAMCDWLLWDKIGRKRGEPEPPFGRP